MSDAAVPIIRRKETERSYGVNLTEIEMKTLADLIIKLYRVESKDHPPAEKTFHAMRAIEKFAKSLETDNFIVVERERLPV